MAVYALANCFMKLTDDLRGVWAHMCDVSLLVLSLGADVVVKFSVIGKDL